MIGGVVRHGRTKRDSRALIAHLTKDPGTSVELFHSVAPTLDAAIADMELARDGSAADAAFLHIHLSPARDMSRDELRRAAAIVAEHLGAEGHPAALVFHDKPRLGGEGGTHAHYVLGRVGPDGQVLQAGFEKIRLETAMRLVEFELGEAPTLGRHHASGVKWLRANGRADVADWLEAAHGPNPEKPGSAASPAKRQALARQGVDLSAARSIVAEAWKVSDGPAAFRAALAEGGLEVSPGKKPGVWLVTAGGTEIGALDRLVKQKRGEVAARMEVPDVPVPAAPAPEPAVVVVETIADADASLRPDHEGGPRRSGNEGGRAAPVPAPGASGGVDIGRAEPDRRTQRSAGSGAPEPTASVRGGRGPARTDRRDRVRSRAAVASLRRAATPRLKALAADLREASRPAVDRVLDALERRRSAAAAVFDRPLPVAPRSPALVAAAAAVVEAKKVSTGLFYGNAGAVQAAEARRDAPEPRGLLARILGRHAEWRRERDNAAEFIERFERAHSEAGDRLDRARRAENRLAVPHHAVQRDVERRHEEEKRRAVQELRDVAAARDLLAREPALARLGADRVLAEARRPLQAAPRAPAPLPEPIRASGLRM